MKKYIVILQSPIIIRKASFILAERLTKEGDKLQAVKILKQDNPKWSLRKCKEYCDQFD